MMHKTGYTAVHGTDEEVAKRWTVLASFVSQVEDKAIIPKLVELQGKDELNPVFNNYKPLEGLYPPEIAQVDTFFASFLFKTTQSSSDISSQVCERLLEGGLTPPLLKTFVRRLREQRTCSWHLEHPDNPFVHESRKNFAEWKRITSSLSPQDFKVHTPRWKWTEQHPLPPWTTISKAPIWSDEDFKTLRESLSQPKVKPVIKSTSAECLTVTLGETKPGEAVCEVRIGPAVGATPAAISGLKLRILVYQIPKGTAAGRPLRPMMLSYVLDEELMPVLLLVGDRPDVRVVLNAISASTDDEFYTRDIALYNKGILTSNYTMATSQLVVLTLRHIKEWKVCSIEISIASLCVLPPIEISIVFLLAPEVHYLRRRAVQQSGRG